MLKVKSILVHIIFITHNAESHINSCACNIYVNITHNAESHIYVNITHNSKINSCACKVTIIPACIIHINISHHAESHINSCACNIYLNIINENIQHWCKSQ
jgi:hypothetical protein